MNSLIFLLSGIIILSIGIAMTIDKYRQRKKQEVQLVRKRGSLGYCPVCGLKLKPGEQIKSVLFPATLASKERICHVFGCPSCYPIAKYPEERLCPVCKKVLLPDGYLIARMFSREEGGKHVHILGCNVCRIGRNNT